jgi:flagellar L-ring protein precursor FlgH
MNRARPALTMIALLAMSAPAGADTLYVSAPPPSAPGHPMNLGADHRAMQIGDLVNIVFDFNAATNNTSSDATNNQYQLTNTPGIGALALPILKLGAGIGSSRSSSLARTYTVVQSLSNSMMATVTDLLPSGAMAISGDQKIMINGVPESMHVTGVIRQQDIDNTDSIVSSRVANIDAKFTGIGSQEKNRGILQKIIGFLFG